MNPIDRAIERVREENRFGNNLWISMYHFLKWAFITSVILHMIGCGDDSSSTIVTGSSAPVSEVLGQQLPTYKKLCIDNNAVLFPSEYAKCAPVYGAARCDNDLAINTQRLNNEWDSISSWAEVEMNNCVAQGVSATLCFSESQMELSRRASDNCKSVVSWL